MHDAWSAQHRMAGVLNTFCWELVWCDIVPSDRGLRRFHVWFGSGLVLWVSRSLPPGGCDG